MMMCVWQAVDANGTPLCLHCQSPYQSSLIDSATVEQNPWLTRLCSRQCMQQFWVRVPTLTTCILNVMFLSCTAYAIAWCPSVCYVSCILSKRVNRSSNFFHCWVAAPFFSSAPNVMAIFRQVIVAYALRLNSWTGTEGSTVSSLPEVFFLCHEA